MSLIIVTITQYDVEYTESLGYASPSPLNLLIGYVSLFFKKSWTALFKTLLISAKNGMRTVLNFDQARIWYILGNCFGRGMFYNSVFGAYDHQCRGVNQS